MNKKADKLRYQLEVDLLTQAEVLARSGLTSAADHCEHLARTASEVDDRLIRTHADLFELEPDSAATRYRELLNKLGAGWAPASAADFVRAHITARGG